MTSSKRTFSSSLAVCARNSALTGEFPSQRPVRRSFDVFFDLRLNERLSKQSRFWWFETPSCLLWRHFNEWLFLWAGTNRVVIMIKTAFPRLGRTETGLKVATSWYFLKKNLNTKRHTLSNVLAKRNKSSMDQNVMLIVSFHPAPVIFWLMGLTENATNNNKELLR